MPTDPTPPVATAHLADDGRVHTFGDFRIAPVDPAQDIDLIHEWVTQERAKFWGMRDADRARVHEIYAYLDSLSTHHAYLVRRDDRPVALFQTYLPEADPIGEHYDMRPGDIGVHLMIGPTTAPEHGFSHRLLTALLDFALADPAYRRVVAEPDARNTRAIDRMLSSGFELGPQAELPDKRAQFVFFHRAS